MAEVKFKPTESQRQAMEAPIMDLLVSAAAGSGKTAVLSRRILRLVSDSENPVSINRMLVVTFTKAAAEELKMRIGKALKTALAELRASDEEEITAKEASLVAAIAGVESAEISTIHSFCYSLIRKHFSELSLSASLRIGEEAEIRLLKLRVMEETVDSLFENDPAFHEFADNLIELKDTRLAETLLDFYEKFISIPRGLEALLNSVNTLRSTANDFEKTDYCAVIRKTVDDFFTYYAALYKDAIEYLSRDPNASAALVAIRNDYDYIQRYESAKTLGFFEMCRTMCGFKAVKRSKYDGEEPDEVKRIFELRNQFKKARDSMEEGCLVYTEEEYTRDAMATAAFCAELYHVLSAFDHAYSLEKASYGMLDFTDLERYAYKLLVKDGEPTELAYTVQTKYDAIFIDEYQDTNDLQDAIFSAISRHNRFMVGDIKQSIYAFRGAEPELFSRYREKFPPYQAGTGQKEATIFLSENFRCDNGVITYSNKIFEKLFNYNSGRVPYRDKDALSYGKPPEDDAGLEARQLLISREDTSEYDVVASEIYELVHKKKVNPYDIVILLRSMTNAEKFRKALDERAISCQCGRGDDVLFDHPEVLLLIALLNVIDNPTRDIYLAAALKSPIFGVTVGELAMLRSAYEGISLYASILAYRADQEKTPIPTLDQKLDAFFDFLEKARRYAEMQSSDKVVRYLFSVTPLRAISVKYCGNCDALMAFYDYARAFESQGFCGLHALCRLVAEVNEKEDKDKPKLSGVVDLSSVRIMSIHASKGCEFEYVFLADTAKNFNAMDESRALVYEKNLGVGLRIRETGGFIRYDTLIRRAISYRMRENRYDEEMRILYVALTRAVKQLIVTGGVKDQAAFEAFQSRLSYPLPEHSYRYTHENNYRDMIASAYHEIPWQLVTTADAAESGKGGRGGGNGEVSSEELSYRLAFTYPHGSAVSLPAKLSVSRLHPSILDEDAEVLIRSEQASFDQVPLFMQDKVTASGAERGTATHLFMQFCDFKRVKEKGIEAEITRLVEKSFITAAIAALIDRGRLAAFFDSTLCERILTAKRVYREERFNVRLPASDFTQLEEKKAQLIGDTVLVQGVVDCLIEEDDGSLVLIDYKTDRLPKDRAMAEKLLRERYSDQLRYYGIAIRTLFGRPVKKAVLYAFSLSDTVSIDVSE